MIYTSYFANLRNMPDTIIPIGICAKPPVWFQGYNEQRLAPSYSILSEYKKTKDEEHYIQRYQTEILNQLYLPQIIHDLYQISEHKDIALCCYEKPDDFCHRHLIANKLKELGFQVEEFDKYKYQLKNQSFKQIHLPVSSIGNFMLNSQAAFASAYHYKHQPKDVMYQNFEKYYQNLPECFKTKDINNFTDFPRTGYELDAISIPIVSRDGTIIAERYDRLVIGQYGAFLEIDDKSIIKDNIKVKLGQEYRITDSRYKDTVKYQWYTTKDNTHCKLYFQQHPVIYADYQPNKWYISPYEVLDQQELQEYFFDTKDHDIFETEEIEQSFDLS